jgi:hypothetical protein
LVNPRIAGRAARLWLALVSLHASLPAEGVVGAARSLPAKETLTYSIEWRLITAGKARMEWNTVPRPGDGGYEARLHLESSGLVSKLFKVNDDYLSDLRGDLCAVSSRIEALEGRRRRETTVAFDGSARKASYLEKDLVTNTAVAKETEIPSCVHDVVGGLYVLRTLHLEPGQSTQIPVSDGKKSVMARVEAQQREQIKTPSGTYRTVRYEAFLFNDVLYRRSAHLNVWLSDDARQVPVQIRIRMQLTVGTITLQLEKEERS